MTEFILDGSASPQKIINHFRQNNGPKYKGTVTDDMILIRKNPFQGCAIKYRQKDGAHIFRKPFVYFAPWVPFLWFAVFLTFYWLVMDEWLNISPNFNIITGSITLMAISIVLARVSSLSLTAKMNRVLAYFENHNAAAPIKDTEATHQQKTDQGVVELKNIRNYCRLFDKERFGFNYQFLIAFTVAEWLHLISFFLFWGTGNVPNFLPILLLSLLQSFIFGLIIVLLSHYFTRSFLIVVVWMITAFLFSVAGDFITLYRNPELPYVFSLWWVFSSLLSPLCFMGGMVLAIYLFGTRVWSLVGGLIGGHLIGAFFSIIKELLRFGPNNFLSIFGSFSTVLTSDTLMQAFAAILLYYGFFFNVGSAQWKPASKDRRFSGLFPAFDSRDHIDKVEAK